MTSIQEELEAVDWYDQRVDATDDPDLAAILAHNRDEEKEHAAMTLEWLRRNDPALDRHLRTVPLHRRIGTREEEEATTGPAPTAAPSASATSVRGLSRRPPQRPYCLVRREPPRLPLKDRPPWKGQKRRRLPARGAAGADGSALRGGSGTRFGGRLYPGRRPG